MAASLVANYSSSSCSDSEEETHELLEDSDSSRLE